MDRPKQQRGSHSCLSTFTPPLHSYPLHPFCLIQHWKHALFFNFLCLVTQATPSDFEAKSFGGIGQVAEVPLLP